MKKFVSLLLILALMLSAQVFVASAEEEPATEEPMVITWLGASPPLTDDTWGEQAFEEAFGVDVQIVRAETAEEQTVLFASGEVRDFILAGSVSRLAGPGGPGHCAPRYPGDDRGEHAWVLRDVHQLRSRLLRQGHCGQ